MGQFTKMDGEALRRHFATEAADAGLRSQHGALVDMALAGIQTTGRSSYEGGVNDRRFGRDGRTRFHLQIRHRLSAMAGSDTATSESLRAVLYAAYGPIGRPWHPQVKQALQELGEEMGVALITPRVLAGLDAGERASTPPARAKARGDRPSGVVIWLPRLGTATDKAIFRTVIDQARAMLSAAQASYAATAPERPPSAPRRRREFVYHEGQRIEVTNA